ncbi:MAG: HEAT repeat domain-containing protein [Deltaproteobacteria bacterium]|nr:HEAT repeat domain-containing protein [Deltaproteobacteria bacterium]
MILASPGSRLPYLFLFTAFAAFSAMPVQAQFNSQQMRQRYQKNTQGTSIEDYVKKLGSDDPAKRLEGVKLLGATHDPKVVEYLIQALGDSDVRVRAKSVEELGEMRAVDSTQVLIQHLFLRTTEPQMKQLILASLGKIGDPRSAKPIMEFLQRDLDEATRGTAIYALGDIGSAEASPTLQQISQDDSNATLRRLAGEALNKVQHHQASMQKEASKPTDTFLPKEPEQPKR